MRQVDGTPAVYEHINDIGYGILKSQIRSEIAAAGFDPSIGLMHGASRNSLPLVYDLMEPLRPVIDEKILIFAQMHTFLPGDFTISASGGCRLNPQMAKKVVQQNFEINVSRTTSLLVSMLL